MAVSSPQDKVQYGGVKLVCPHRGRALGALYENRSEAALLASNPVAAGGFVKHRNWRRLVFSGRFLIRASRIAGRAGVTSQASGVWGWHGWSEGE